MGRSQNGPNRCGIQLFIKDRFTAYSLVFLAGIIKLGTHLFKTFSGPARLALPMLQILNCGGLGMV